VIQWSHGNIYWGPFCKKGCISLCGLFSFFCRIELTRYFWQMDLFWCEEHHTTIILLLLISTSFVKKKYAKKLGCYYSILLYIILNISILNGQKPPACFENSHDFVDKHDYSIICYPIISEDYTASSAHA